MPRYINPIVLIPIIGLFACSQSAERPVERPSFTQGAMVAAADVRAVDAALEILAKGGHAVDAAIAAHTVLGLVEPQSSGLGGGAFMLVYEHDSQALIVIDGRETAPANATPDMFMQDRAVYPFRRAWQSGKSVGVPGVVALYKAAHDRFGKLHWAENFAPAIKHAEEGFVVSPTLNQMLERIRPYARLDENPATAAYFYPEGEALATGARRDNPEYAHTLQRIAEEGIMAFYSGQIAQTIVDAASAAPDGGNLSLKDIADYKVKIREPVCAPFRVYKLCSAPPPSSGGIAQNMILGLYDRLLSFENGQDGKLDTLSRWQLFVDAQRLAYADRDHYVADADFVDVPVEGLIHPAYLDARVKDRFAPGEAVYPGDPGAILHNIPIIDQWGRDSTPDAPGTTHLSIIDSYGNAVSMTATIEAAFGSSRMASGFLLNNELTDFSLAPEKNGKPVANAVAPFKRPRSSMSPSIVFDEKGELFMVTGSPGGNSIISYVAKTLIAILDWGMNAQDAVNLPNIIARGNTIRAETQYGGDKIADSLRNKGYEVRPRQSERSGLHVIVVREDGLEGGADPRREGAAKSLSHTDNLKNH